MRIGIVCYPTFGGSGSIASELGLSLMKEHEVHFISYAIPFKLKNQNMNFHKVNIISYPLFKYPPYTLALTSKIVEVIKRCNLDLLHVHYAIPHSTSAYLAKKASEEKVKIVTTLHGTDVYLVGLDPSYKSIVEFSLQHSDGLTAVSNFLKRLTLEKFNIKRNVEVIHDFVDPEKFKRITISNKKEKIICHVSNFRTIKRVPDVIHAFNLISKEIPCNLYLVGNGPEKSRAKRMVHELKLEKKVRFFGNIRHVQKVLGKANLFLLLSELESFGLVALEAMSCEVPVIATNVGGLPEVIEHGKSGYLVNVGDIEAVVKYSLEILQNPERAKEIGRSGRQRVLENFSKDKIVPKYLAYYKRILEGNQS